MKNLRKIQGALVSIIEEVPPSQCSAAAAMAAEGQPLRYIASYLGVTERKAIKAVAVAVGVFGERAAPSEAWWLEQGWEMPASVVASALIHARFDAGTKGATA